MTRVSGGSITPLLKMDLNYIAINKDSNSVGPVRVENVALLETSNFNVCNLSKLLNSRWKIQGDASKVVMLKGLMV